MSDERPQQISADHDLLIRLDTKFDILASKFDDLSENLVARVDALEKDGVQAKAEIKEMHIDIGGAKADIKVIYRYLWMAVGALGLVQAYLIYRQVFPHH